METVNCIAEARRRASGSGPGAPAGWMAEVAGVLEEFSVGETFLLDAQDLRL